MNAPAAALDLAAALVVLPGGRAAVADGDGARVVRPGEARELFEAGPVVLAHAAMTARRLGLHAPPRSVRLFDVLELFAFVRPAKFCAPSAAGLALACGLPEPKETAGQALGLREVAALLLSELAAAPTPSREEALALAETLGRAGWAWAAPAIAALRLGPIGRPWRPGASIRPPPPRVWPSFWPAAGWTRRAPPRPSSPPRPRTRSSRGCARASR